MNSVMGIIYTSKDEYALRELTSNRSVSALPVAARYRLIDFLLSNLVNSGVRNVGIMMQGNYQSLMDHLGSGKEWDLHTRNNGLFLLPPFRNNGNGAYAGIVDALKANMDYLRRSKQDTVLLMGGKVLFNACFDDMFKLHAETDAAITVMYSRLDPLTFDYSASSGHDRSFVRMDDTGCVIDIEVNPNVINYGNILSDVMLIKRTLLMHLIDIAASHNYHDFNKDVLPSLIKEEGLKVVGYRYDGYLRRIETIKGYYNMSMDLLNPKIRRALTAANPVYTKTRDDPPSLYLPGASVKNSLVADGCIIEGTVENCVLFRGTHISKGARIKNSVIFQDCHIGKDCEIENAIFDKDIRIITGGRLVGFEQYPVVLGKGVTL